MDDWSSNLRFTRNANRKHRLGLMEQYVHLAGLQVNKAPAISGRTSDRPISGMHIKAHHAVRRKQDKLEPTAAFHDCRPLRSGAGCCGVSACWVEAHCEAQMGMMPDCERQDVYIGRVMRRSGREGL